MQLNWHVLLHVLQTKFILRRLIAERHIYAPVCFEYGGYAWGWTFHVSRNAQGKFQLWLAHSGSLAVQPRSGYAWVPWAWRLAPPPPPWRRSARRNGALAMASDATAIIQNIQSIQSIQNYKNYKILIMERIRITKWKTETFEPFTTCSKTSVGFECILVLLVYFVL